MEQGVGVERIVTGRGPADPTRPAATGVNRPDGAAGGRTCPLCDRIAAGDVVRADAYSASITDAFPVSDGHTLVVPVRHVADLNELDDEEFVAAWRAVRADIARLRRERSPDGFNIGVNMGAAGGQTVQHAHVHVIPRYRGDVADARGGVRWVIPERAPYWEQR